MDSPYDVLGIEPDADEEAVKRAYRRRAKETHPDLGGSPGAFRRVRAAYEQIRSGEPAEPLDVEPDEPGDRPVRTDARVEYLDYEVLDDHGWDLDDDDLFEKAADAGLDPADYGKFLVEPGETLLEAAENRGFTWPYACRGGACANCSVAVLSGELSMPVNHILPPEMLDRNIRLSCVGGPITPEAKVVYNVKHLPDLEELLLPPGPFLEAQADG